MATHDALRRSLKYKLKLILSENKILVQTIEDHVKKAEAVYRDTECLERIPTSVFKQAMSRLETAYSACIKLILLASDLFESDNSNFQEKAEKSNSHKLTDSDKGGEPLRTLDKETLRRLSSLERKFQAYVVMREEEAQKGQSPNTPAVRDWYPKGGQFYRRGCGAKGMDICYPPDPVTELNRFLFGLECQSYDGYKDPRIILSNERKKFPNEVMVNAAGEHPVQGPVSPTRDTAARADGDNGCGIGIETMGMSDRIGDTKRGNFVPDDQRSERNVEINYQKGQHTVSNSEHKSMLCTGSNKLLSGNKHLPSPCIIEGSGSDDDVLLNSPGALKTKSPRIGRRSWRRDKETCRNLVEVASEKLRQAVDDVDNLPLYWLKRGRGIPSPPSPPPPTSVVYRSPLGSNLQMGLEKGTNAIPKVLHSPNSDKTLQNNPGRTLPNTFIGGMIPYDRTEMALQCQEYDHNRSDIGMPKTGVEDSNYVTPAYSPSVQCKMSKESGDIPQNLSPSNTGCPWFRRTSPGKPTEQVKEQKRRNGCVREQSMSPQRFTTPMEHINLGILNMSTPQAEFSKIKEENQFKVDDVQHILIERISNLERLLEQEISAEKSLLTQCLIEIQKLLSCCLLEDVQRQTPGWKDHDEKKMQIRGDKYVQNVTGVEDTSLSSSELKTSRLEVEAIHGTLYDLLHNGKHDAVYGIHQKDYIKQPTNSLDDRKRRCQLEMKKLEARKSRKQATKKTTGNNVREKEIRACFEQALATLGLEKRDSSEMNECNEFDNFQYSCLNRDVTTTSCSSTNAWEDSGSSRRINEQEYYPQQGKVGRDKSRGNEKPGETNKKKNCVVQGRGKRSTSDEFRQQHQNSPKSSLLSKSTTEKERLRECSDKAQREMFQAMIQKLNAYLLKVSDLAKNLDSSTTAGRAYQDAIQKQDRKVCPNLGPPLVSTEPTAVPNTIYDATSSLGINHQGDSKANNQKNITTQTCNSGKCLDILEYEQPMFASMDTPKAFFQQVSVGRSNVTPCRFTVASSPTPQSPSYGLPQEYPSVSAQDSKQTFILQNPLHQAALQHVLLPDCYIQNGTNVTNVSQLQPRSSPEIRLNVPPSPKAFTNHQQPSGDPKNQYQDTMLLQMDHGNPYTFQHAPCSIDQKQAEENVAIGPPQIHIHPIVQVIEDKGNGIAETVASENMGQPIQFYSNLVHESNGVGDILIQKDYTSFIQQCQGQTQSEFIDQGLYQQHGDPNQSLQSPKHKDHCFQIPHWPEQHELHHNQLHEQPQSLSHQNESSKLTCPEHLIGSQNEFWQHPQQLLHLQQLQHRNCQQQHQVKQTNIPQQASMPVTRHQQKIQPSPKVHLPNSCPTVAFASPSCEPTGFSQQMYYNHTASSACPQLSVPQWTSNQANSTCKSFPTAGLDTCQGPESRSRVKYLHQQFDSCVPSKTEHTCAAHPATIVSEDVKTRLGEDSETPQKLAGPRSAVSRDSSVKRKAEDRTVCLTNLPPLLAEMDLLKSLNEHGFVSKIYFIKHRTTGQFQGTAYVKFRECPEAESAVNALNGLELEGQKVTATLMSKKSPKNLS